VPRWICGPNDGYIVDSLGWAHYRLGEYEDAVRELERAVELRPADPTINDHLGDAYWQVGREAGGHLPVEAGAEQ
jgi:Flp pilus assembly protein TadD